MSIEMNLREYLELKIKKSEEWRSRNPPTDIYYAYANVQIGVLNEILTDFKDKDILGEIVPESEY